MKLEKIEKEIQKTRDKIGEMQSRLKELTAQKTEAENMEIVDVVRGMDISLADLAAMLKQSGTTSGQLGPKLAQPADPITELEDSDNEE